MPKKKHKPRKKKKRSSGGSSGSGGSISGMRSGFQGLLGKGGAGKKESVVSKVITYVLLAAAVAMLVYRLAG